MDDKRVQNSQFQLIVSNRCCEAQNISLLSGLAVKPVVCRVSAYYTIFGGRQEAATAAVSVLRFVSTANAMSSFKMHDLTDKCKYCSWLSLVGKCSFPEIETDLRNIVR